MASTTDAIDTTGRGLRRLNAPSAQLDPWPLSEDQVTAGSPDAAGAVLWLSDDKRSGNGVWQVTPGSFTWDYTWDETMTILEGAATVSDDSGAEITLSAGDALFIPSGVTTTWTVTSKVRKVFHFRSDEPVPL